MKLINHIYRRVILIIMSFLILGAFLAGMSPVTVLTITGDQTDPLSLEVKMGESFDLEFIHSLYNVRQMEIYQIEKSELILKSVFFEDYSAAAYYDPYSLYPLIQVDGGYEINGLQEKVPSVQFAIAHGTQYSLRLGQQKPIDLHTAFKQSSFLRITVEVMPRAFFFVRRIKNATVSIKT